MFTKEELQQRINTITAQMAEMRGQYAKLEGHLGECGHWLLQLEQKDKESSNGEVEQQDAGQVAEV